ncbi:hypothetical protein [Roseibacillus persicicus]|uniref:hypothetical protein n=1 Tax=Roseibacillus persicicus TaxID=454148 RepID=UPI00280DE07C|nr:hypothetical protein [Roseibacillus persicicus]MDQ8190036.1 hypothetical protein [Roseibacillus persicicus]
MTTTETKAKTCQACAYWEASSDKGECRRHAPQNIVFEVNEKVSVESRFPITSASNWCGDFSEK